MNSWRSSQGRAVIAGTALLLLNSAYLASTASPTLFYFANVVAHIGLGLVLGVWWAMAAWRGRRYTPAWMQAAGLVLVAGAVAGLAIVFMGAAGRTRWLLPVHISLVLAGGVPLLAYAAAVAGRRTVGRERLAIVVGYVVVITAAAGAVVLAATHDSRRQAEYRITNPAAPLAMSGEGAGPESPFFPSSADTNVHGIIPANFFMTSASCGRCHKEIYDEWKSSMHHFSSFNNQWYRKSVEYMQDTVGTTPSKWCAGCHDHAVFFNGRFDKPIKQQIDTPEAQAGLACTSCHAIVHVGSTMGQGNFSIEYPPLHDLAASDRPFLRFVHDTLTYIDPQPHREIFLKPFHQQQPAQFCSSCHKVHLDVPVNSYRWFRGFNEYDNWQASGVSGEGARSFYYPPASQTCSDCHMPLEPSHDPAARNGFVRSHRFAAANTAVPFVNHDNMQLAAAQAFLKAGAVSVDVFGIVRGAAPAVTPGRARADSDQKLASTFAVGEESMNFGSSQNVLTPAADVLAPIDKVDAAVHPGDSLRVEVVVRTRKVGHFFPGGTVDAFDVWVELEAVDDAGRVIFHSGEVADDGKGPVDPGAHFYRALLLDEHGNVINKRNAWAARTVAYVRLIPPGAADTIHYRLNVPKDVTGQIHLTARVNYRKFSWWNTQWAYAGVPGAASDGSVAKSYDDRHWQFTGSTAHVSGEMKAIPAIPTTEMARGVATLRVVPRDEALPQDKPSMSRGVRERWNDYGIGLLLQGDIKNAEAAFLKVTQMDPGYADGWVNVGRARLQEGNVDGAEQVLRKALEVDPNLAKSHFFLGVVLKTDGRYDEALQHLQRAADLYPRDRVVLNQLGRVMFLQRHFAQATEQFQKVLAIDPEDLQAHYNLMLCAQGQGDKAAVARERALYDRFKADEASQALTGTYRQLHPEDNNERQQIHEHIDGARRGAAYETVATKGTGQ
jgi:tetratricopeptide (TPR) repeat protein